MRIAANCPTTRSRLSFVIRVGNVSLLKMFGKTHKLLWRPEYLFELKGFHLRAVVTRSVPINRYYIVQDVKCYTLIREYTRM
jgi:hypothetical protein